MVSATVSPTWGTMSKIMLIACSRMPSNAGKAARMAKAMVISGTIDSNVV